MNPTENQLKEAIADLSLSDVASEALENLADEYGHSLDAMEDNAYNEAESQLWATEDCFSYLEDNDITDWNDAVCDGGVSDVLGVARFFLDREIREAIDSLRAIDFDLEYPQEEEDEEEGE